MVPSYYFLHYTIIPDKKISQTILGRIYWDKAKNRKTSYFLAKPFPPVLNVVWDCAQIVWVPDYAQKLNIDDGGGGNFANLVDFCWKLEFVPNIMSKIVWDIFLLGDMV